MEAKGAWPPPFALTNPTAVLQWSVKAKLFGSQGRVDDTFILPKMDKPQLAAPIILRLALLRLERLPVDEGRLSRGVVAHDHHGDALPRFVKVKT